jgi:hypothetical protein
MGSLGGRLYNCSRSFWIVSSTLWRAPRILLKAFTAVW